MSVWRALLGVQDRALAVLNALLTFYPESELCAGDSLLVFPSNTQLTARANGISGATLRRSLAVLVEAGLITRHDSPNGKCYAHRDREGQVEQAYGFSLAPLLNRSNEIALKAEQVAEEARLFKRAKEALTLCRRDIGKLLTAAIEDGIAGDWTSMEALYATIDGRIPRNASRAEVESILVELTLLREEVLNQPEYRLKAENVSSYDAQNERHIQNSNTELHIELNHAMKKSRGRLGNQAEKPRELPFKAFPLAMVLQACPAIADYAPTGQIDHGRALMSAAVVVRSMLGISPSAYQNACTVMGQERAAVIVACILEREGEINSDGGNLRDLTARVRRGKLSISPVVMALLRSTGQRGGRPA